MRLRSVDSYNLLKNGLLYSYPCLRENIKTEIVVVGGGITGALISHALMDEGYKTILIDKRDIAQGSTSATTSMLQYEIDVALVELAQLVGEAEAVACYKAGVSAIKKLGQLITDLSIDCSFENKKSLYIAHSRRKTDWLKAEYEIRNRYDLGVQWLNAKEIRNIYGIKCYGGILSDTAASVDAYKLAHELIHYNSKRGMQVFDSTEIDNIDYNVEGMVKIKSDKGFEILCRKIVFCTGFEALSMIDEKIADTFSTYASISEQNINIMPKLKDILVWNTAQPYLYMRVTHDNRLLVGGEDSSTNIPYFREKIKSYKSRKLENKVARLLPNVEYIEDYNWAGMFSATKDGLPYIGSYEKYDNAYFVLGFGGNGITFSVQGMELIIKMLQGKTDNLLEYYKFGR